MVSACLGSLHHGHPLVIVTEEREVKVRAAAVRLGANGQLTKQPTDCFRVAPVFGVHYGVFESERRANMNMSEMTGVTRILSSRALIS